MRAVTAIESPPVARIAAATSSQGPAFRAEITTFPPASAIASAIARPIPRLEPVIIAAFPDRSNSVISLPRHRIAAFYHGRATVAGFDFRYEQRLSLEAARWIECALLVLCE